MKYNYEIFCIGISAREKLRQNNAGPHQGVNWAIVIWSICRPSWIGSSHREFVCRNVPFSSLFVVHFFVLPPTCEVSQRKRFQKPPESAEFVDFVIKRWSANHSWRPSSKAAPKRKNETVTLLESSKAKAKGYPQRYLGCSNEPWPRQELKPFEHHAWLNTNCSVLL